MSSRVRRTTFSTPAVLAILALAGCGATTAHPHRGNAADPSPAPGHPVTGTTAAGTTYVARIARGARPVPPVGLGRLPRALARRLERQIELAEAACPLVVQIQDGRAGDLSSCLGPGTGPVGTSVDCNAGLVTITAGTPPGVARVRLTLSDGRTVTSTPIAGGRASLGGLYYQVIRGPSPTARSLTLLSAAGRPLGTRALPAVVDCTAHPLTFLPGGIRTLASGRLGPPGHGYTIVAQRYRFLGRSTSPSRRAPPPPGRRRPQARRTR